VTSQIGSFLINNSFIAVTDDKVENFLKEFDIRVVTKEGFSVPEEKKSTLCFRTKLLLLFL